MAWRSILWIAACATLVAGCAPSDADRAAARVNGAPILEDEVALVRRQGGDQNHAIPQRRLVEDLVVKELLAQQYLRTARGSRAVSASALAVARRELLARDHVAALAAAVTPPDEAQVRAYYLAHPELFAERRIFLVRALEVAAPPTRAAEVLERVQAAPSLERVVDWLRTDDLRYAWSEAAHPSDELDPDALARLTAMRPGDVAVVPTQRTLRVIQLVRSHPAGLDERAARPLIEQRLLGELRAQALEAEVDRLARLAAISIGGGQAAPGNRTLALIPGGWPAVFSRSAPNGPVTGGAPGGGDAQ